MPKNKLKLYKVIWEESRFAIVEAESPEKAVDIVMQGDFDDDHSKEMTTMPEAFEEIK